MDISGLTLIRHLNIQELSLDYAVRKKYNIFVNAFIVETEYDLFKDFRLVEKAIDYWKSTHPFLRCKIYAKYTEPTCEPDPFEKFFFYVHKDDEIKVAYDVLFLDFVANGVLNKYDYWKLLFEREFTVSVDQFFNHLWTLKIIKLDFDYAKKKFNFCFLLNINHSVSDNLNAYALINELCHYIDQAESDRLPEQVNDETLKLFTYEFDYPNDVRNVAAVDQSFNVDETTWLGYKVPEFFKPQKKTRCGEIQMKDVEPTYLDGVFQSIDNARFLSVQDILDESRESYVTKFCFSTFPKDSFLKISSKANEHNVRLVTCFSLITALAVRNVYRLFSDSTNAKEIIDYSLSVSLRALLDPQLENRIIGSWFLLISFGLVEDFNEQDKNFWSEKFWSLAKKATNELYEKLNDTELKNYFKGLAVHFNQVVKGLKCNGFVGHFSLSFIEPAEKPNEKVFIKEHRKGAGYEQELTWSMYTNHKLCAIDGNLFWDMTYSSYQMKSDVAECLMDNISEIYYKVIEASK